MLIAIHLIVLYIPIVHTYFTRIRKSVLAVHFNVLPQLYTHTPTHT